MSKEGADMTGDEYLRLWEGCHKLMSCDDPGCVACKDRKVASEVASAMLTERRDWGINEAIAVHWDRYTSALSSGN